MKTQVIQLELNDDLVSVLDKMSWAKTPRILLVWPRRKRLDLRLLDLTLLQRHASKLGAQLGLVCTDREIRLVAEELGIPVFLSATEAQRGLWSLYSRRIEIKRHMSDQELTAQRNQVLVRKLAWRIHPAIRLASFSLGVLSVLAILLIFLPSAVVYLSPESRSQIIVLPVSASPDFHSVSSYDSLPAYSTRVVVEGMKTLSVSSLGPIPDKFAIGTVQFRNLTGTSIIIPVGTVVHTQGESPVRFRTTVEAQLHAGASQVVEVPAQALLPGSEGNLEADTLQIIEGSLGLNLAATNPEPTMGGADRLDITPTDTDRVNLHELLFDELRTSALSELQASLSPGDTIFPDSLSLTQTLQETYSPLAGQPGNKLSLFMKLEFEVYYASVVDLGILAQASMDAGLPPGYVPQASGISIAVADKPATEENGITRWQMRAERTIEAQIEPAVVIRLIRGLPREQALPVLETALPLASQPRIVIVPRWWSYLPFLPFRISVVTLTQSP